MDKKDTTASESQEAKAPLAGERNPQMGRRAVRFVEEGVKTQYAAIFNIGFGAEEVLLAFGNPSFDPNMVKIESKVVVSLKTAKRFAVTLSNLIRRYEAKNGAIDISVPKTAADEKPKIQ
jgi:hypothetical protein